jgi:hypothetical protein
MKDIPFFLFLICCLYVFLVLFLAILIGFWVHFHGWKNIRLTVNNWVYVLLYAACLVLALVNILLHIRQ